MSVRPSVPVNLPILLGTSNTAKQDALRWLVEDLPLSPTTPAQMGLETIPEEAGDTHQAIARTKAIEWSRGGSSLAIASDGGLLLPILGSRWESRHTHRFAGPEADNARRLECLLHLMRAYNGEQREASWVEAVAIADQGRLLASWELEGAHRHYFRQLNQHPSGYWVLGVLRVVFPPVRQDLRPTHPGGA